MKIKSNSAGHVIGQSIKPIELEKFKQLTNWLPKEEKQKTIHIPLSIVKEEYKEEIITVIEEAVL